MARETKAQKTTRISMLLADYDARSRELRKLAKEVDALKDQVRTILPGTYGEWQYAEGTPREIMDQPTVREAYKDRGEALPTKMTEAPIIVLSIAS